MGFLLSVVPRMSWVRAERELLRARASTSTVASSSSGASVVVWAVLAAGWR